MKSVKAYKFLLPLAAALSVMLAAAAPQSTTKAPAKTPAKAAPKTAVKTAPKTAPTTAAKQPQRTTAKAQAPVRRPAAQSRTATNHGYSTARRPVRTASGGRRVQPPVRSWRTTQRLPSSDRYKEIQEALVAKGYPVNADGTWGNDSVEALKKFQKNQNLEASGKLNSLSLIALGLGPKRGSSTMSSLSAPSPDLTGTGAAVPTPSSSIPE